MEKVQPTLIQKIALCGSEGEYFGAFVLSVTILLIQLFGLIIYAWVSDFSLDKSVNGSDIIFMAPPVIVFVASAIILRWLSKKYIIKNITGEDTLLEVNDKGQVINYCFHYNNLIKSLSGNNSFHGATISYWYADGMDKEIHYQLGLKISDTFELLTSVYLILKKNGDFNPQEIYDVLVKSGVNDLKQYFSELLDQAVSLNKEKLTKLAEEYHKAEISESQFCQQVMQIIQIGSPFSNLKVSQLMMDKPIRFAGK